MSKAVQAVAVLDDGFPLHVVQHQANHLGGVLTMVEKRYELGNRPLEIDVVFPERVIGIDEQSLGVILSSHVIMITAPGGLSASINSAKSQQLAIALHPIDSGPRRNNSCLVSHIEQPPHGFAAVVPIVEGALVDVHANEFVGELGIEIASKLHRIGERLLA